MSTSAGLSVPGAMFFSLIDLLRNWEVMARLLPVFGEAATLKGGLALELRLERARTTKDIDLRMVGSPNRILDRLQEAGRVDLGDFMTFEVQPDAEHPGIQNDGMQYEGMRFRAECRLASKIYGQVFGVDVAFGDPMLGEPETLPGPCAACLRRASGPKAAARRHRADVYVPANPLATGVGPPTAECLGRTLRADGRRE